MRNVLAKAGEQPWTPSLMYDAPQSLGSTFMELAMPPVTCSFSKTMTMNLSGCFEKAYAAERPAAPAPTMATRWVFMFVVGKSRVIRSKQLKGKRNTNSPIEWCNGRMGTQQTEHRADTYRDSAQNIIISNHNKSACVRPINPQSSGILQWSRDFLQRILGK